MRLIDADELRKDVDRLIEQYEDMMKECENDRRYRLYLDIDTDLKGRRCSMTEQEIITILCKQLEDRCPPEKNCILTGYQGTCRECWVEWCREQYES